MRVRIDQQEKSVGVLASRCQVEVSVQVEFTQEELLIINCRGLQDFVVLERAPDSRLAAKLAAQEFDDRVPIFDLRVRDLMNASPERFTLDTPSDAKAYQANLTEALKQLKSFIADNAYLAQPTILEF